MKKLREKLNNKQGFTLVELIVVIVIILVLAAVLVPNVLKYIDKANRANCKSDAATQLTQLQADAADWYSEGKEASSFSATKLGSVSVSSTDAAAWSSSSAPSGAECTYKIGDDGSVVYFAYCNGTYAICYTPSEGWSDVVKANAAYTATNAE